MKILIFTLLFTGGIFLCFAQSKEPKSPEAALTSRRLSRIIESRNQLQSQSTPQSRSESTSQSTSQSSYLSTRRRPSEPIDSSTSRTRSLSPTSSQRSQESVTSTPRLSSPPRAEGGTRIPGVIDPVTYDLVFRGTCVFAIYHESLNEFVLLGPDYEAVRKHGKIQVVKLQDLRETDILVRDKHLLASYSESTHQFMVLPAHLQKPAFVSP